MKYLLIFIVALSIPVFTFASGGRFVYVHDGDFMSDYSLVEIGDGIEQGNIYLVELGIGCFNLKYGLPKWALWTGSSTFLDGIGDDFVDMDNGDKCHVWDAFDINDWQSELSSYDYDEFFRAVNSL